MAMAMATAEVRPRTIVVAMDESDHSFHALEWALSTLIPNGNNDRLVLLHAKSNNSPAAGGPGYILSAEMVLSMDKAHDREIEKFMNTALQLCQEKQVIAEVKVVPGDPREVICDSIEKLNADFLVIGSHGYGAIKRVVLGSVSDYCAHHAKCPVVIVRKTHKRSNHHQQH